jgi:hypothetical protein
MGPALHQSTGIRQQDLSSAIYGPGRTTSDLISIGSFLTRGFRGKMTRSHVCGTGRRLRRVPCPGCCTSCSNSLRCPDVPT